MLGKSPPMVVSKHEPDFARLTLRGDVRALEIALPALSNEYLTTGSLVCWMLALTSSDTCHCEAQTRRRHAGRQAAQHRVVGERSCGKTEWGARHSSFKRYDPPITRVNKKKNGEDMWARNTHERGETLPMLTFTCCCLVLRVCGNHTSNGVETRKNHQQEHKVHALLLSTHPPTQPPTHSWAKKIPAANPSLPIQHKPPETRLSTDTPITTPHHLVYTTIPPARHPPQHQHTTTPHHLNKNPT